MININDPNILHQIKAIGYPTMLLGMILEGPIVTIASAFSAKLGFFNVYLVFILSMLGDIIGDVILYCLGYFGGSKFLTKAENFLKIKPQIIEKIERLFSLHGKKTIFAVKSTTGLCWITFIAAGTFKMKFKDFMIGSVAGGIIWSAFLVIVGYFFGYAFKEISQYIKSAGIIIFIAFVVFYSILTLYKKYQAKKYLK